MTEKAKMPVSFYQVGTNFIGDDSFDEVVDTMKRLINAHSQKFVEQKLSKADLGEFKVRVFHATNISAPKWRSFIREIVTDDSPIKSCQNTTQSFLLFVGHKDRIFAVTGGAGFFAVDQFVSQTFGIDVITRLIDKTTPVIKSLENRGVTGTLMAQAKYFRADSRLSDESQFGQIYKAVRAELDKKILTSVFGFRPADLKREVSGCLAKNSFKINKSLGYDDFFRIVGNLNSLLDKPANFTINSVEQISKKKSPTLIRNLDETLISLLYNSCEKDEEPDFDFTHWEIDKYVQAAYYKITIDKDVFEFYDRPTLLQILRKLKTKDRLLMHDEYEFKCSVLDQRLQSINEDGVLLTQGTVLSHLHGEIFFDGRSYFIIDGEWYRVSAGFANELNDELKLFLEQHWDETIIDLPFDHNNDEGVYNSSFIGKPGILVFDTIVPENIEPCDLLKYDANSICLIHVKKGFNNMIRDLASQIKLAAKRLQHDRKHDFAYITALEDLVKEGRKSSSELKRRLAGQSFPPGGLSELFKGVRDKQICFCLAFVDTVDKPRKLKDNLTSFRSNIAKYSLLELIKEINAMGFDFKIVQLPTSEEMKGAKEDKAA